MKEYKNLLTATTLIPLWAKAVETISNNPILTDNNAYPTLKALGYDLNYYDKKKQNPSQVGCCLRAKWMDDEALDFIKQHGKCQVIQLGAGLDDRFKRICLPEEVMHWYDLDLDEVADLRRKVLPVYERNEIIKMNLFDTAWMRKLKQNRLPTLIIIEGVMMYLQTDSIKKLFHDITHELGNCTVIFDSIPDFGIGKAKFHDSVKKYNRKIEYTWGLKEGKDIEQYDSSISLNKAIRMSDLPQARKFRLWLRWLYKIPFFYRNANQWLISIDIRKE